MKINDLKENFRELWEWKMSEHNEAWRSGLCKEAIFKVRPEMGRLGEDYVMGKSEDEWVPCKHLWKSWGRKELAHSGDWCEARVNGAQTEGKTWQGTEAGEAEGANHRPNRTH